MDSNSTFHLGVLSNMVMRFYIDFVYDSCNKTITTVIFDLRELIALANSSISELQN